MLVALFGVMFLGERLSSLAWGGVTLIVVGVLLITLAPSIEPIQGRLDQRSTCGEFRRDGMRPGV